MGLTVADVVELKEIYNLIEFELIANRHSLKPSWPPSIEEYKKVAKSLSAEISSLKISPEKVVGMVSISEDKLKEILNYAIKPIFDRGIAVGMRKDEGHIEGDLTEERDELVREIISNKSKILSLRKD